MFFPSLTSLISLTTAFFAISATAAPLLEQRANPNAPAGKGSFQLMGVAAGALWEYGGLWVTKETGQAIAVMTQNQSLANAFKYHPKTGDVYYNAKSDNVTSTYSLVLTNTPIANGAAGYYYVNLNVGYANSDLAFTQNTNDIELHHPDQMLAVCYEKEGPSPGLGLVWRNTTGTASSTCLDVNLKAVFNH